MRRDMFKQILDSRINVMRKYVVDPTLTTKQRQELKKSIRRRERIGNDLQRNKYRKNRVNMEIYSARSPKTIRTIASRYRDHLLSDQHNELMNRAKIVRQKAEQDSLKQFMATKGNYRKLLANLRAMQLNLAKTKRHLKRSS